MSIKMHAARVSKDQFWEFAAEVRRVYLAEHLMVELFRGMVARGVKYSECMKSLSENDNYMELQLFDEGDAWLIRPLEVGWFFINKLDEGAWDRWNVEAVTYDNRCDIVTRPCLCSASRDAIGSTSIRSAKP